MNFICETFSRMSVIFRDGSNEPSSIMIGYSDATVTMPNHHLIVRSNTSLYTVPLQYHNCEVGFVIRLYLICLINGQSTKGHPNTAWDDRFGWAG